MNILDSTLLKQTYQTMKSFDSNYLRFDKLIFKKLASLKATLVRNYDPLNNWGEVYATNVAKMGVGVPQYF